MTQSSPVKQIATQVRYINSEWKHSPQSPRIGSKESRRANTSFQDVTITDTRARFANGEIELDRSGFTLSSNDTDFTDFKDADRIRQHYYPQMAELVCALSGAQAAYAYGHLVRTETPTDFNDGYARFVHCDYNIRRLQEMSEGVLTNHEQPVRPGSTYVWFNTWQPFDHQVQQNPLACIDWESLPNDDVIDYYYTGRGNDSLVAAPVYNPDHRWCYFERMETHEVLVMKQMDPRPDRSVYCPHTSFHDPEASEDVPPRRSIEMRWLAVMD